MSAQLMDGRVKEMVEHLQKQGKSKNEIDHLLFNRNNLIIKDVTVMTRDGEEYLLPFRYVYIMRD